MEVFENDENLLKGSIKLSKNVFDLEEDSEKILPFLKACKPSQEEKNLGLEGFEKQKKAQLSAEIGDLSFWDNVCELLIKEMHYQIDILRSALSYHKSEMNNL